MSEIVTLKIKKKYGKDHNKIIKKIPYKYEKNLCDELQKKLTIYNNNQYYGFIPYFNKYTKEPSKTNENPLYVNITYIHLRNSKFFKIIKKDDSYSHIDLFIKIYPELIEYDINEKHFISIGKLDNIELFLIRLSPKLLSNGITFQNIPSKYVEKYGWLTFIDFYTDIKNSKKKIYKQVLSNTINNLHLNTSFYPDLDIQQEKILDCITLKYIYTKIIEKDNK